MRRILIRPLRVRRQAPFGIFPAPITETDLVGPLANMPLSVLVAAMRAGGTYANVHTNDGVPPANEGPGDFPGGEIRGEIQPAGP